jgi:hypothetical protein
LHIPTNSALSLGERIGKEASGELILHGDFGGSEMQTLGKKERFPWTCPQLNA